MVWRASDDEYLPNQSGRRRKKNVSPTDSGEIVSSESEDAVHEEEVAPLEIGSGFDRTVLFEDTALCNVTQKETKFEFDRWDECEVEGRKGNSTLNGQELIKDESDYMRLKQMSEREREEELFRRVEQLEAARTRIEITRSLQQSKKNQDTSSNQAYTADVFDSWDDDSPPPSMRDGVTATSIDQNKNSRLKVSEVFGDIENEDDRKCNDIDESESIDEEVKSVDQLEMIRISRHKLERWVHMPFFNSRIPGFFVRVNIGSNSTAPVYRVAQVIAIYQQDVPYKIGSTKTNKTLRLRHCKQEKSFKLEYVSNQPFTEVEFQKWKNEFKKCGEELTRMSEVYEKLEDLEFCSNYRLNEADVESVVREKGKFNDAPVNYALLKTTLSYEIDKAKAAGDEARLGELQEKLEKANRKANLHYEQCSQREEKMKKLSEKNRQRDIEEREKAIQEEMIAEKNKKDDPFTRRKTLPSLIRFANSATLKPELKKKILEEKKCFPSEKDDTQNNIDSESISGTNASVPRSVDSLDLSKLHDFEIDINLDFILSK